MKELFCREYFIEAPVFKNASFTATRHFLIDGQNPAAVYYWPALRAISTDCDSDGNFFKRFDFADGCCMAENNPDSAPLLQYARQWLASNRQGLNRAEITVTDNPFFKFYFKMVMVMVVLILFASRML